MRKILNSKNNVVNETCILELRYQLPYDWSYILEFLDKRMVKGIEYIIDESYTCAVNLGSYRGWIKVSCDFQKNALLLEFSKTLIPVLPILQNRICNLFDLDAKPDLINAQLIQDKFLEKLVKINPGIRVPGAFDSFELVIRAILGQQITVKAATTLVSRFVNKFSERCKTPYKELYFLAPKAEVLANATIDDIAKLGIISARARCIIALAKAFASGELTLEAGVDPDKTIKKLTSFPGIGQWTAHYIAMRTTRWPDAFPKEDVVIRKKLGGLSAKEAERVSQLWRPWRSYAVLHIWKMPNVNTA